LMNFIWEERAIVLLENSLNSLFLSGGASFGEQVVRMLYVESYFKPSVIAETLCLIMES
jgi:hypothetical protein